VLTLTCQDRLVVVQTLAFLVLRQMLSVVGCGRTSEAKDVEIAVLGHQLAVLGRQVSRPRYTPGDRMVLARLAKLLPRDGWKVFLVTPSTLLRYWSAHLAFDTVFAAAGIEVVKIPPRAPKANAFAERWERPVRHECLDWVLICNRRHLENLLATYVMHYNTARPHRGINLAVPAAEGEPAPAEVETIRRIERVDLLGGLVHEYRHAA
jgi:hypothetical protein